MPNKYDCLSYKAYYHCLFNSHCLFNFSVVYKLKDFHLGLYTHFNYKYK